MKKQKNDLTRRDFIKKGGALAAGITFAGLTPGIIATKAYTNFLPSGYVSRPKWTNMGC